MIRLSLIFLLLCVSLQSEEKIANGVMYDHIQTEAPHSIHILKVDPKMCAIKLIKALNNGLGRETLSSMSNRADAIAGINGGFFKEDDLFDGEALGALKIKGQWIALPSKPRGAIGWTADGKNIVCNRIRTQNTLSINEKQMPLNGLNQPRSAHDAILYSWPFHRSTLTQPHGYEVMIQENKVLQIRKNGGNSEIPKDGYVYSCGNECSVAIDSINVGDSVQISSTVIAEFTPSPEEQNLWQQCDYIVGGTPLLIKNGARITDYSPEAARASFLNTRHPRSAVGVTKDNMLILVIVDGRNPSLSIGMTIAELALFMEKQGCVNAVNLDGGGSSTMAVRSHIVNSPCGREDEDCDGKYERKISDAIIIMPKEIPSL